MNDRAVAVAGKQHQQPGMLQDKRSPQRHIQVRVHPMGFFFAHDRVYECYNQKHHVDNNCYEQGFGAGKGTAAGEDTHNRNYTSNSSALWWGVGIQGWHR